MLLDIRLLSLLSESSWKVMFLANFSLRSASNFSMASNQVGRTLQGKSSVESLRTLSTIVFVYGKALVIQTIRAITVIKCISLKNRDLLMWWESQSHDPLVGPELLAWKWSCHLWAHITSHVISRGSLSHSTVSFSIRLSSRATSSHSTSHVDHYPHKFDNLAVVVNWLVLSSWALV